MIAHNMFRVKVLVLVILISSASQGLAAFPTRSFQDQKTKYQSGIDLYERGDFREAVPFFKDALKRDKDNAMLWFYLGMALERMGKLSDARKAHEKAAKGGELLLTLQVSNTSGPDYLDLQEPMSSQLHFAAVSARKYLELGPNISERKQQEANERADLLIEVEKLLRSKGNAEGIGKVISSKSATTKARILFKPEPQFTEEAKKKQTTGTVILRAVLGRDGKVYAIIPIKLLPDGLTRRAILAARQINFQPATLDGQPVSVLIQLEYNFNLY